MNPFKIAAKWIKDFSLPSWMKLIMQDLNDLIISFLIQIGKEYILQIKTEIIRVSELNIGNEEKFKNVFSFIKGLNINLKDSTINLLIEMLVKQLKKNKAI